MMRIGFWEIVFILVVALIVIGPDKLPEYMRSLGKGLASLRGATRELTDGLQEDVIKPLNEAVEPLKEAMEPLADTAASISGQVDAAQKSLESIQHPVKSAKERARIRAKEEKEKERELEEENTENALVDRGTELIEDSVNIETGSAVEQSSKEERVESVPETEEYTEKAAEEASMEDSGFICPSCGNHATGKFCNECGAKRPSI